MSPIISFKPRKGIGNMLRLDMKQAEPPPHPTPHHQPPCSLSNKLKLGSKEIEVVTANGGDGGFF